MTIISTVLAMVAIGVVAVWSILSHVTATGLLVILRPFRVNDYVSLAGEEAEGKVVDLNLFYTVLETPEAGRLHIPNNLFFQKIIKVKRGENRIDLGRQLAAHGENASASSAPGVTEAGRG